MIVRDPQIFRDLFTDFIIDEPFPKKAKAITVDGKRYPLRIVYDSKPQRYAIDGKHDLKNKEVFFVE